MSLVQRAVWGLKQVKSGYIILISVVLHMFVRSYVAVAKAKFAENVHFVLCSPD